VRLRLSSLPAYCVLLLAGLIVAGCGGAGKASSTSGQRSSSTQLPVSDGDKDIDSLGQGPYDTDNDANPTYGPAASASERQAIVALIEGYYKAAAAEEGARACSMLDPLIAEAAVEEHRPGKGSPRLRGRTCAQVLARVFAQRHHELVADAATLRVGWIQRQARQAVMLVHFGSTRELTVRMHLARGRWQMNNLLDSGPL
jgi:hypothetical protein